MLHALKHWMKPAMPVAAALVMSIGLAGVAQAHDDDEDYNWYSRAARITTGILVDITTGVTTNNRAMVSVTGQAG
jgi:hypothetical protein